MSSLILNSMLLQTLAPLPGMTLWEDATQTPTGAVASWTDFSGNGNNATQGTSGNRPTCTANSIHGRNAVVFGGVSTTVSSIASSSTMTNMFNGGGTIYVVFSAATTGGGGGGRIFDKTSGSGGWQLITNNTSGSVYKLQLTQVYGTTNGTFVTTSAVATFNTSYVLCVTYDSSATGNVPVVTLNGGSAITLTTTAPTGSFVSDSGSVLLIGNNPGGIRNLDGDIGETIYYPTIHSANQKTKNVNYLRQKWGI